MKIIESGVKIPIKSWCEKPDSEAINQAMNLANLPFAHHHIALMPDVHVGFGMPVGGVMATDGVIIPNAVGVDIGCGMLACKTNLESLSEESLKAIMGKIRQTIPVGFNHRKNAIEIDKPIPEAIISNREYEKARYQAGTLGGGNHFIEIQNGSDGFIWFMIHSGSRNIGKQVADYYNRLAKDLNKKWGSEIPTSWDLAFLPTDTKEGKLYIEEMNYCQNFAQKNRDTMAEYIQKAFEETLNIPIEYEIYNIHHNYAGLEHHFGKDVWVHRKGATSAKKDEIGIIPGSQGTKSYIVLGKGNPQSFTSCSHGAGRKMGRKEAQRSLSLEDEIKRMDKLGILHGIRGNRDLDEAPGAYKDIDVVMKEQEDLVDILVELLPMGVVKG